MPNHAVCNRVRRNNANSAACRAARGEYMCSCCGSQASIVTVKSTVSSTRFPSKSTAAGVHDCALCTKVISYFKDTLTCGHHFHGDCLWKWLKRNTTHPKAKNVCPTCGLLPAMRSRASSVTSDSSASTTSSTSSLSRKISTGSSTAGDDADSSDSASIDGRDCM